MTIRKIWLIVLILVVIVSIAINAFIFISLTDRYYKNYLTDIYDQHIEQIIEYLSSSLATEDVSFKQMALELETHLDDPIIKIKLYNPNGDILVEVEDDYHLNGYMGHGRMFNRMKMNMGQEYVEKHEIIQGGKVIAYVNVTTHSSIDNSIVALMFKSALFMNSILSMVIALILSIIIGIFVSKSMSSALKDTAKLAHDIQVGVSENYKKSGIVEIKQIRQSLEDLSVRLKLKQKSRKALVDQLIHQTRTPLTILKSHVEAIEDGIIEINPDELSIFQNQIENITMIIANMGSMIDAEKETAEIVIEEFEINQLLKQIMYSLKTQFDKRNISLKLLSHEKIKINSDKYKLSQAFYNILTNAYKYTKEQGSVTVSYEVRKDIVAIKIQDTGIGISSEELNKIFNAYYRVQSVTESKGEGIGLYVVKENLKLLQGDIIVDSKVGIGSTFIIELPKTLKKVESQTNSIE